MKLISEAYPLKTTIIGDYSLWPRRTLLGRRKLLAAIGGVGGVAVFVHCVMPILVGASL